MEDRKEKILSSKQLKTLFQHIEYMEPIQRAQFLSELKVFQAKSSKKYEWIKMSRGIFYILYIIIGILFLYSGAQVYSSYKKWEDKIEAYSSLFNR